MRAAPLDAGYPRRPGASGTVPPKLDTSSGRLPRISRPLEAGAAEQEQQQRRSSAQCRSSRTITFGRSRAAASIRLVTELKRRNLASSLRSASRRSPESAPRPRWHRRRAARRGNRVGVPRVGADRPQGQWVLPRPRAGAPIHARAADSRIGRELLRGRVLPIPEQPTSSGARRGLHPLPRAAARACRARRTRRRRGSPRDSRVASARPPPSAAEHQGLGPIADDPRDAWRAGRAPPGCSRLRTDVRVVREGGTGSACRRREMIETASSPWNGGWPLSIS